MSVSDFKQVQEQATVCPVHKLHETLISFYLQRGALVSLAL